MITSFPAGDMGWLGSLFRFGFPACRPTGIRLGDFQGLIIEEKHLSLSIAAGTKINQGDRCCTQVRRIIALLLVITFNGGQPVAEMRQRGVVHHWFRFNALLFEFAIARHLRSFRKKIKAGKFFTGSKHEATVVTSNQLLDR